MLEKLTDIRGLSSDESRIAKFVTDYVNENSGNWKTVPKVVHGSDFQDSVVLVFGEPRTAIYAHLDTIGYSVGYSNNLIPVGGPRHIDGTVLTGADSNGEVEAELVIFEQDAGPDLLQYVCDREIDRGTLLSFQPDFRVTERYVQSPYLDNRLGVFAALKVAETLENGAIVFSCYEEHGGNSVEFCADYLYKNHAVRQALICDITWVTNGVIHGAGVAISMRDSLLPRKRYLDKIIGIARKSGIPFQLEVESAGGSDGSVLQKSGLPVDWCFIGAAEDNVHSPNEKVYLSDIDSMISLYETLMSEL